MDLSELQPCLVCGRQLQTSNPTKCGFLAANDAIFYSTSGNYGSTVLDDSGTIVFLICDACLVKFRGRLRSYGRDWKPVPIETVIPNQLPENSELRNCPIDDFITGVEEEI
jgi:hypothetical protein